MRTFSFSGFSQRGGGTDHHADGWGIAFFEGKGLRLFIDHQSAAQSPMADFLKHYPIRHQHHCPCAQATVEQKCVWKTPTPSRANCGAGTGCLPTMAI